MILSDGYVSLLVIARAGALPGRELCAMASHPVEALIAAAMGPLALNFAADVNVHFAPLVSAALTSCGAIVAEAVEEFGWSKLHGRFLHGRPDLNALASKIKHLLLEVRAESQLFCCSFVHRFIASYSVFPSTFRLSAI